MAEDEEVKRQNCHASSSKSHKTKQIDASKKIGRKFAPNTIKQ